MSPLDTSRLRHEAVRIARSNIGYGDEGTNSGRFINALGGKPGREWCALFVGYCYRRAYDNLGFEVPTWVYRRADVLETGAKALTKACGRIGRIWKPSVTAPMVGDLVCWSRGVLGWQGHVGIVTRIDPLGHFDYISGNEGKLGTVLERQAPTARLWRFASVSL
jgi:hypothetical protein